MKGLQVSAGAGPARGQLLDNLSTQETHPSYRQHSARPQFSQAASGGSRLQRLNARAASIAHEEALRDAKRALRAINPEEKQELRRTSAILFALSRRLEPEVAA